MSANLPIIRIAIDLANEGSPCFPCREDKTPATPHGFLDASADASRVIDLWRLYPGPLIGVVTGAASCLDVLDIDPRNGGAEWLANNEHRLPPTWRHHTRSGGVHIFFWHHAGLRNSAGRIAPGVDVRADGGYIIWWPAAGLRIEKEDGAFAPQPWPAWLIDILDPPCPTAPIIQTNVVPFGHGYAVGALRQAIDAVASAHPGARNETLNKEAFSLSRFARSGALDPQAIADALATAGLAAGLTEREVRATLASAFRAAGVAVA